MACSSESTGATWERRTTVRTSRERSSSISSRSTSGGTSCWAVGSISGRTARLRRLSIPGPGSSIAPRIRSPSAPPRYRGFRAPSLNELYRPFRLGNVVTEANPDLTEEYLWGLEGGVDIHPNRSLLVRLNGFYNSFQDPVANVTISSTPALITRQRQNLGSATIQGFEAEVVQQLAAGWSVRGAYLFSDAVVDDTGLDIPQSPRNQGVLGVGYDGRIQVTVDFRLVGDAYDDDLNQLLLPAFNLLDLLAAGSPVEEGRGVLRDRERRGHGVRGASYADREPGRAASRPRRDRSAALPLSPRLERGCVDRNERARPRLAERNRLRHVDRDCERPRSVRGGGASAPQSFGAVRCPLVCRLWLHNHPHIARSRPRKPRRLTSF